MYMIATACRMLLDDRRRLALSCVSIAFAVVIMFMQMGFFNGLRDSQASLARYFDADLVMSHRDKDNLKSPEVFSRKRLRQALAVKGVASAVYLHASPAYWWNPQDGSRNRLLVLGVDPARPGVTFPALAAARDALKRPNMVIYDRLSRKELGRVEAGTQTRLGNAQVQVAGLFDLGANFSYEGHVIASYETFYRIFSQRDPARLEDDISLGLLKLEPGTDATAVQALLRAELPDDFLVLPRAEVESREKRYTTRSTPAGIIFGLGLLVALAIGVMICYQLLYNEIQEHLPQFATLKAIGYRARDLHLIVLAEALLLCLLGFVPGIAATQGLYLGVEHLSEIIMELSIGRALFILALTVIMAAASAALAVRQVVRADPAELF
jgi:putative ABC transport system permease protein